MKRILSTIALVGGVVAASSPLLAEPPDDASTEARIRAAVSAFAAQQDEAAQGPFCKAWRQLKLGMPFHEAEELGIEMNGACTPGKPQSFHQPYMDLYFDAECRALHGATTVDC